MERCNHTKTIGQWPASYYALKDFKGKIGFISALGHCFCRRAIESELLQTAI